MRERNGYRGPHDFLSGLCVQRVAWLDRQADRTWLHRPVVNTLVRLLSHPADLPAQLGPFRVRRALAWRDGAGVLLAEDDQLGRSVWLWVRSAQAPALPPARREVNRLTRLRWLAEGSEGELRWDAFVARNGCPLTMLVRERGPVSWEEARALLESLAGELTTACAEHTVPASLAPRQVWVQIDGQVFLIDPPLKPVSVPEAEGSAAEEARALALLRRVAVLSLEGQERPDRAPPPSIHAPLPLYARALLQRLLGTEASGAFPPYDRVAAFAADLSAHKDYLPRVSRMRKLLHILLQGGLFLVGYLLALIGAAGILRALQFLRSPQASGSTGTSLENLGILGLGVLVLASLICAPLARGGPSFALSGLALVRADGRRAARWQAGLRCLLVWVLASGLVGLPVLAAKILEKADGVPKGSLVTTLFVVSCLALILTAVLVAWLPRHSPVDRVVRTYLVPR
jgi:hypothetical protein